MTIVQKITTMPTFHSGVLVPAGMPITIDVGTKPGQVDLSDDNSPNLAPVGSYVAPVQVEIAAIGPTGPNPTNPQQVPPGTIQVGGGYYSGGAQLVGERTTAPATGEGVVEEEAPVRRSAQPLDDAERLELEQLRAGRLDTGGILPDGERIPGPAETHPDTPDPSLEGFDAAAIVDGTIPEVEARLTGLTPAQLNAVKAAEATRDTPRIGVNSAIDALLVQPE